MSSTTDIAQLYREHNAMVRTLLMRTLSVEDAEDVAQDVWLKVLRSIHTFNGSSKFRTWLHTVTVNMARNFVRRSRARKRTPVPVFTQHAYELDVETIDLVRKAFANMKLDAQRAALERLAGASYRDLSIPGPTFLRRQERARAWRDRNTR